MRRALILAAGGIAAAVLHAAPANADDTVVVHGVGFPTGALSGLGIIGCPGIFDRVAEPVTSYLSKEPAAVGARSLKYDLAGGNAVGSQYAVTSMAGTTTAGLSVQADGGTAGVAYAGYRAPADWSSNLIWIGRAELAAAPGGWQQVDVTGLSYTWTRYDLATEQPVPPDPAGAAIDTGPATVAAFTAAHGGDGPGFYTLGFGCDGQPFRIDALRVGSPGDVTTYDLEGLTSATGITGSASTVSAGDPVTIAGNLDDELGRPVPHGLLVLEAREPGSSTFVPVDGAAASVADGSSSVTVAPSTRTLYRWQFAGTWSIDGSVSPTFSVDVDTAVTVDSAPAPAAAPSVSVTGVTRPAKPGVRATLWRLAGGSRVPVASTAVGHDGGYRFELARPRQAGEYVVTVPAASGNLAGESPARRINGR